MVWKQEGAQPHDPDYLVAMRAHHGRQRFHLNRLAAGQPQPSSVKELLLASMPDGPKWVEQRAWRLQMAFLIHRWCHYDRRAAPGRSSRRHSAGADAAGQEGAKSSTVLRRLAALSSLFKHLVRHGVVARSPVVDVGRPSINRIEGSTAAFSKIEARKMLDAPGRCGDLGYDFFKCAGAGNGEPLRV
jgi:hypothetical protein